MTQKQLIQIEKLVKPLYRRTGRYHSWSHIQMVKRNALAIAGSYKEVNIILLQAAVYLHDIGRVVKSGDHVKESLRRARRILSKIKADSNEIDLVCEAIASHDIRRIHHANAIEAKILFDADKLEIATVRGFFRMCAWLVDELDYPLDKAVNFVWTNIDRAVKAGLVQTKEARSIIAKELPLIKKIVERYNSWGKRFSG